MVLYLLNNTCSKYKIVGTELGEMNVLESWTVPYLQRSLVIPEIVPSINVSIEAHPDNIPRSISYYIATETTSPIFEVSNISLDDYTNHISDHYFITCCKFYRNKWYVCERYNDYMIKE